MAYMGQLYDSEYIEQVGFTDVRPTFVRADENNKEGREVKEGNYVCKLKYKVPFVPLDEDEESKVRTLEQVPLLGKFIETSRIYKQSTLNDVPEAFVVKNDFPKIPTVDYLSSDGEFHIDNQWKLLCDTSVFSDASNNDDGSTTFSVRSSCDEDDAHYRTEVTVKYGAYYDCRVCITKRDDDDEDNILDTLKDYTYNRYTVFEEVDYYNILPTRDLSELFNIDTVGFFISFTRSGYKVYENVGQRINPLKAYSRDKVATINELLPFDGYYSRAFCTDYNATKKYYRVNVTEKSNSVILGNLIADKVVIKKYRDDELKETIEIVPDCYIDKDGILPKVSTTIFCKLDLLAGDVLEVEFFGDKIVVGNIETSYMIDDGLTKYDFSSGYTNYNNRTEEF